MGTFTPVPVILSLNRIPAQVRHTHTHTPTTTLPTHIHVCIPQTPHHHTHTYHTYTHTHTLNESNLLVVHVCVSLLQFSKYYFCHVYTDFLISESACIMQKQLKNPCCHVYVQVCLYVWGCMCTCVQVYMEARGQHGLWFLRNIPWLFR